MAKLSIKQIATGYAAASVSAAATGLVGGYLWEHLGGNTDYALSIGVTWFVAVGLPSIAVSAASLRRALGERQQTAITASPARAIPFTSNGRSGYVFNYATSAFDWMTKTTPDMTDTMLPEDFTISVDGVAHTITEPEIVFFLRRAWSRQRAGQGGLSRLYWTKTMRPALSRQEYEARMTLLLSVPRLVINRGERRSGKLSVPPETAKRALMGAFSLG